MFVFVTYFGLSYNVLYFANFLDRILWSKVELFFGFNLLRKSKSNIR